VSALMTATYLEVARRVVEFEQGGENGAAYGQALLVRLSGDLTKRFGRGFGVDNLELKRLFSRRTPGGDFRITDSEICLYERTLEFRTVDSEV
jgi:hypothetical protein